MVIAIIVKILVVMQARIGPLVNRSFTESNLQQKKKKKRKKEKEKKIHKERPKQLDEKGPLIYALNLTGKGLQIFMRRI